MRKIFLTVGVLLMICSCLGGCNHSKGCTVQSNAGMTVIELDSFSGRQKIKLKADEAGDASLFYVAELTEGEIKATLDTGFLWDPTDYFCVNAQNGISSGGTYIDSSVSEITLVIESDLPTDGRIILIFDRDQFDQLVNVEE